MPRFRKRNVKKGRRVYKGRLQHGAGSGGHLVAVSRPPAIPRFERMLSSVGLPIQRFRQFRASERLLVSPASGRADWYGVPDYMDFGTPMYVVDQGTAAAASGTALAVAAGDVALKNLLKQTPNSGDLFDIYKNLTAGVGPATPLIGDSRFSSTFIGHAPGAVLYDHPYGTQSTYKTSTGTKLHDMVPTALRVVKPGMDYTMRVHVNYDNVSSLDAFVEVYRLDYIRPKVARDSHTAYDVGEAYTTTQLCDKNAMRHMVLQWNYTRIHPGSNFSPAPNTALGKGYYHAANFAGGMLRAYAHACLFQRMPAYTGRLASGDPVFATIDIGPGEEAQELNTANRGTFTSPETIQQVVCNPLVDPLRVTPPTRPASQLGFKMTRVVSARRVKPGDSGRFDLPFLGTRRFNYADSHVGQLDQDVVREFTGDDAESCPVNRASIYCFRVWGDMIHGVAPANELQTDFQTGSTSVTFHTQRVVWARYREIHNSIVNPTLLPFDSTDVPPGEQVHINEETDAPMGVGSAETGLP